MAVQDLERIEQRIDRAAAGAIAVSDNVGGVMFKSMSEVLEFAKLMSVSDKAVPKHLRANPGACLAVTIQALEWRMSPFAVANKSYEVNDRIAYESQLIHAVIEARAPLKRRLRATYSGELVQRKCTIIGEMKDEIDPLEYESPTIEKIKVKNSPLWTSDPDQQLFYYASRAWARRYCPDVLLGIYSEDELRDAQIGPENARDITPAAGLKDRLKGQNGRGGFHADNTKALPTPTDKPIDFTAPAATKADAVTVERQAAAAEQQPSLLVEDVESEVSAKIKAINNAETEDDIRAMVEAGCSYCTEHDRKELSAKLMKAGETRGKALRNPSAQPQSDF